MNVQTNMPKSPSITHIVTNKPGRPASTRRKAESLIGTSGVEALAKADLHIVSGAIVRELCLLIGTPFPMAVSEPEKITEGE